MQAIKPRKWIVLSLSFLLFLVSSNAQDEAYQPMLVNGAVWDDVRRDGASLCGYSKENSFRYEVGGDTSINQQIYKYLYRYPLETGNTEFCTPYWIEYNKKELFTGAFFREDSLKRQVFIYLNEAFYASAELSDLVGNEYLLYDFSLSVGDTLKSGYAGSLILDKVDSVMLYNGGKKVKRFSFGGIEYAEQMGWLNFGGFYTTPNTWGIEDYVTFYCEVDNKVIFSEGRLQDAYPKFIERNKYFDVGQYEQGHICNWSYNLPNRYFFEDDTLIHGNEYSRLYYYRLINYDHGPPYSGCPPFKVDTIKYVSNIFIREDTINKKVYKREGVNGEDQLLFDLSLNIGDTLGDYLTIDTIIEIVTLDNIRRKKFIISDFGGAEGYYIEGIGGNRGPFIFPVPNFEGQFFTMCIKKNNVPIYGDHCYDFVTSVTSQKDNLQKVKIYPTIIQDNLHIELEGINNAAMLEIYSITGTRVANYTLNQNISTLNISHLTSGIYLIKLITIEKLTYTAKFYKM